jgi:hypothetical protein
MVCPAPFSYKTLHSYMKWKEVEGEKRNSVSYIISAYLMNRGIRNCKKVLYRLHKSKGLTPVKTLMLVFWVIMQHEFVGRYQRFKSSMILRNVSIHLQVPMALQPRRPILTDSTKIMFRKQCKEKRINLVKQYRSGKKINWSNSSATHFI